MKLTLEVPGLLGAGSAFVLGLPDRFHLKQELRGARSIKLATAFAHWSGWQHLLPHIDKTTGTVKLLTGLSFCQTEPRVLSDWCARSRNAGVEARLFADKRTTFHPKVLLVQNARKSFAVVGSGNLSNGGFLENIECGLYCDDIKLYASFDAWFETLFCDEMLTKQLSEPDIRRYKKRFDVAKKSRTMVERLQQEAEEDISERHRAALGRWKHAVSLARAFFRYKDFPRHAVHRQKAAKNIKAALRYPGFDFDKDGLDAFYNIDALGHMIQIRKPRVWKQRAKLQAGLRQLVDDSKPIEARLDAVLMDDTKSMESA